MTFLIKLAKVDDSFVELAHAVWSVEVLLAYVSGDESLHFSHFAPATAELTRGATLYDRIERDLTLSVFVEGTWSFNVLASCCCH